MPPTPTIPLTFRIVLRQPPPGVDFGLQLGPTATASIAQLQRSTTGDLHFEFPLKVVTADTNPPDFRGPAAQGPKGARFVYICAGQNAGQWNSPWSRRLKVPLTGLTTATILQAVEQPAAVFETTVPGTARDGGPNCATVKPFDGWKLQPR